MEQDFRRTESQFYNEIVDERNAIAGSVYTISLDGANVNLVNLHIGRAPHSQATKNTWFKIFELFLSVTSLLYSK